MEEGVGLLAHTTPWTPFPAARNEQQGDVPQNQVCPPATPHHYATGGDHPGTGDKHQDHTDAGIPNTVV